MRLGWVTGLILIVPALAWIAFELGLWPNAADKYAQCKSSAVAGGDDLGGPFELINTNGQTVTDKDIITEPSLVYFGYTYCPDVCPMDVSRNAAAVDVLADRGLSVTPVFISIDPKRDTPKVVGEFVSYMHPKMVGLTGTPDQVKAASDAYRTYFKAHEADDDTYLVDHTTMTYLVMPQEGYVDFFRRDISPADMAEKVACFVENQ